MSKKIGVLGTGMVGQVLASGFLKHGYQVKIATRQPGKWPTSLTAIPAAVWAATRK